MRHSLALLAPALLAACATPPPPAPRGALTTVVEGVHMRIEAQLGTARVATREQGESVGEYRRALLAELEIARLTRCGDVELREQTAETVNRTTTATLNYSLADCPPAPVRR